MKINKKQTNQMEEELRAISMLEEYMLEYSQDVKNGILDLPELN